MTKKTKYSDRIGTYITNRTTEENFKAYCPKPLPPNPPLVLEKILPLLEKAHYALGVLDSAAFYLPSANLLLYCYIRKEALLSSQIEGTQSTLSDLLMYENKVVPGVPIEDVEEVLNYVAAIRYGIARLKELPVSLRLIKELHGILLKGTRGQSKNPGEFRSSQNWIGGSRPSNAMFIPPPPHKMMDCLSDLEKFIHEDHNLPVLVKISLVHLQFETIHPFLDGNGRLGRLLITLLLISEGLQNQPYLYLSLYLKNNRNKYYSLLQEVRLNGTWEEWVFFFLKAVDKTAMQASETIVNCLDLAIKDQEKMLQLGKKSQDTLLALHKYIQKNIVITIPKASNDLKITQMTITKALNKLCDLNIMKEVSGKHRGRVFVYQKYLSLLDKGTEPLRF